MVITRHVIQQLVLTAAFLLLALVMYGLGLNPDRYWPWFSLLTLVMVSLLLLHNVRYISRTTDTEQQSRYLLETMSSASPVIVWTADANGVIQDASGRALQELGWNRFTLIGRSMAAVCGEDPEIAADARRVLSGDRFVSFKALNNRYFRHHYYPLYDSSGACTGYNCISVDLSREHDLGAELQLSQEIFAHTADAIVVADEQRRIISVNQAFTRITGFSEAEVRGKKLAFPVAQEKSFANYRMLAKALATNGNWAGEIHSNRKSGEVFAANVTMSVIRKGDLISHYVAFFSDITEIRKAQEELQYLANHDNLTGLPNRRLFLDRLDQAIKRARRKNSRLAILFIDLDNFKTINDSLGHAIGDDLLKSVGARLQGAVRESDTVARLAGDEFTVIAENIKDSGEVVAIAKKILTCFKQPFVVFNQAIDASASVGIGIYPEDGDDMTALMSRADTGMYRAKAKGGQGYYYLSGESGVSSRETLFFPSELRLSLKRNQLQLLYQPQMVLQTGEIVGCEALLRWNHHCRGQIMPSEFLPMAEEKALISEIGMWVADNVCEQLQQWRDRGVDIKYAAINVASSQLTDRAFLANLRQAIDRNRLPPKSLLLEISEQVVLEHLVEAHEFMEKARSMGVACGIDEFGITSENFTYIRELPLSMIKVDQKLLAAIKSGYESPAILRALAAIAEILDVKSVAVGVERTNQEKILQQIGFQLGQGYLYAKPMTAESFSRFYEVSRNMPEQDWQVF